MHVPPDCRHLRGVYRVYDAILEGLGKEKLRTAKHAKHTKIQSVQRTLCPGMHGYGFKLSTFRRRFWVLDWMHFCLGGLFRILRRVRNRHLRILPNTLMDGEMALKDECGEMT